MRWSGSLQVSCKQSVELPWLQISEFIASRMGLHFPPDRRADLQRGLGDAAREAGFDDAHDYARWLLSTPLTRPQLQLLASHLTIGETYFFRERKMFEALAEHVIPELVQRHRKSRQLRVWSAACCTGEEPYSLAILLQQCIPDLKDWHVTLLATDINERFLQKAAAGIYGEWSFREAPPGFKQRYFTRTADGRFAILPQIRQRVKFAPLNLAEDVFPSLTTDTQAMDLILCRNALMYFTAPQAARAVENLRRSLLDEGWFVVSSTESSHTLLSSFKTMNFPGAILYKKSVAESAPPAIAVESVAACEPDAAAEPFIAADSLYSQGRYQQAAETLLASLTPEIAVEPRAFSLLARSLANEGKLQEALECCERWIAADPLDSGGRYLHAVILEELGNLEEARRSLQQALYLHPQFVLAHFALGNLARAAARPDEAKKHFSNALTLLNCFPPEDALPESDGLTAGRLKEIVSSLLAFGEPQ